MVCELRAHRWRKQRRERCKLAVDFARERALEPGTELASVGRVELADPLLALPHEIGKERDGARCVVVDVREKPPPRGIVGRRGLEDGPGCRDVTGPRKFLVARRWAEAGSKRRLSREARRERIDRLDGKPRRMEDELPAVASIGVERGACERARAPLVCRRRFRFPLRLRERSHDALAHLPRRLAGERHRHDLFRTLDARQEREEALDQELGLPRSGRRLDEERSTRIERALARGVVLGQEVRDLSAFSHRPTPRRRP